MSAQFLTNTQLIVQSTQSLYQELLAFMGAVNSAKSSLSVGVAGDTWQNNYMIAGDTGAAGTNNDSAQIGMIKAKVDEDLGLISKATDPATVTQLAGEIRGLLHTYQGFFKPGDPNYSAAYRFSNQILGQLNTVGTASLTHMGVEAGTVAGYLGTGGATMQSAQDMFITALSVTTVKITALNTAVDAFGEAVKTKLGQWATDIQSDMKTAGAALTKAMNDFTTALGGDAPGAAGGGGGGGGKGPIVPLDALATSATSAVGDGSTGLVAFTNAVNAATHALNGGGA
jgi:hypothetical protein